jgi:uncharacterized protein (UPF0212 family)
MVINPLSINLRTKKPKFEVADVLRQYGDAYREQYPLTGEQARVMDSLMACRTAALGIHVDECSECGALEFSYSSCGDRHCPKCGKFKKAAWVEKQKVVRLPIPYFHVVFTIDHLVNQLVPANRQVIYDLLFQAASETLKEFAARYLKGELGFTLVLQTWDQQLGPHLHLHCVATGGGLSFDGKEWRRCGKHLFPIIEFSAAFRSRFCEGLGGLYQGGALKLVGRCEGLDVAGLVKQMQAKSWEVFAERYDHPEKTYEYLSRYVQGVAIANHRITNIEAGWVTFTYRDNKDKDKGKQKELRLPAVEFIRRFLWHVLPPDYHRIRHYGLHSSAARAEKLPRCRELLGWSRALPEVKELEMEEWLESLEIEVDRCPQCGARGTMFRRTEFDEVPWLLMVLLSLKGLTLGAPVKG